MSIIAESTIPQQKNKRILKIEKNNSFYFLVFLINFNLLKI